MPIIFISYRRADSNEESRLIYDALVDHFGEDNVFRDKDRIPKGVDFRTAIEQYIFDSDEMLVLIGQKWLDIREDNDPDLRRLDNPEDFVRIEIDMGLRHVANVTPVILQNADMPTEEELPRRLVQLGFQNAYFLRPDHFDDDLQNLVEDIANRYLMVKAPSTPNIPTPNSDEEKLITHDTTAPDIDTPSISQAPAPANPHSDSNIKAAYIGGAFLIVSVIIAGLFGLWQGVFANPTSQPTNTSTITQQVAEVPTDTISDTDTTLSEVAAYETSDIQLTTQAELFATETSASQTQAVIVQQTENARMTEQFVIGSTATHIAELSLTPSHTNIPSPTATFTSTPTDIRTYTPTPTTTPTASATTTYTHTPTDTPIPDWFKRCEAYPSERRNAAPARIDGVIANGEWGEWIDLVGDDVTSCGKFSTHPDLNRTFVAVIVCDDKWQFPPVTASSQTLHQYDPTTAGFDLLQVQITEGNTFLVAKNMVGRLPTGINITTSHRDTDCLIVELSSTSTTTAIEMTFFDVDSSGEFTKLNYSDE